MEDNQINTVYLYEELFDLFGSSLVSDAFVSGEKLSINSYRESTIDSLSLLKFHGAFVANYPVDIVVIDSLEEYDARFTLVYILRDLLSGAIFHVITKTTETTPLISSQSLFPAFNWAEREIWDFFGIFFVNHSDLRRILTDYGFSGYPLRKDFPLSGYQEVHFDDPLKSIEYRVVELSQAFRTFRHTKIWESEV
jgi:NADH:ubiquinone oxidoreductase subunit C